MTYRELLSSILYRQCRLTFWNASLLLRFIERPDFQYWLIGQVLLMLVSFDPSPSPNSSTYSYCQQQRCPRELPHMGYRPIIVS
jgi:hypothetical protein